MTETNQIFYNTTLDTIEPTLDVLDDFVSEDVWNTITTIDKYGNRNIHIKVGVGQEINYRIPKFYTESSRTINFDVDRDWTFEDAREYNRELSTTLRNPKSSLRRKLIAKEKKDKKKRKIYDSHKERNKARSALRDRAIESLRDENYVFKPRKHTVNKTDDDKKINHIKQQSRMRRLSRINNVCDVDEKLSRSSICEDVHLQVNREDIEIGVPRTLDRVMPMGTKLNINEFDKFFDRSNFDIFAQSLKDKLDLGPFEKVFSDAHTICILLYQLQRSRNFGDYFTAISAFLKGFCSMSFLQNVGLSGIAGFIASRFMNSVVDDEIRDDVHLQVDVIKSLKEVDSYMDQVLSSTFASNVTIILVSAAALKFFHKDVAIQIYQIFGKPEKGSTMGGMLRKTFSAIVKLMEKGQLFINGECSLTEVFFEGDILQKKLYDARSVLAYRNRLYDGLAVDGQKSTAQFATEVQELLKFFQGEVSRRKPKDPKYGELFNTYMELNDSINDILSKAGSRGRTPPFAIIIHGTGGVGKSHLIKFIVNVLCEVMGWTYSDSLMYCRNAFQDYFTGYQPLSQPVIRYPEMGTVHRNIVSKQGDPALSELTAVVDSLPFACNMAEVENKGKIFVLAKLIIIDTNKQDLNLDVVVNNPTAFQRRFLYIEPIVKPEYREGNSNQIDGSKCQEGPMFDRWYFNVSKKRVKSNSESVDISVLNASKLDDIYDLKRILKEHFTAHFKGETDLIAKIDNDMLTTNYDIRPESRAGAPNFYDGLSDEEVDVVTDSSTSIEFNPIDDRTFSQSTYMPKIHQYSSNLADPEAEQMQDYHVDSGGKFITDRATYDRLKECGAEQNFSITEEESNSGTIFDDEVKDVDTEVKREDVNLDSASDFKDSQSQFHSHEEHDISYFDRFLMWFYRKKQPVPRYISMTKGVWDILWILFSLIFSYCTYGIWSVYLVFAKYAMTALAQYWFGSCVTWFILWSVISKFLHFGWIINLIMSSILHNMTAKFTVDSNIVIDSIKTKRNEFDYHCDRLCYRVGLSTHNPEGAIPSHYDRHLFSKTFAMGIMIAGLAKMLHSLYNNRLYDVHDEAHTEFVLNSEYNEALNTKEDSYHCGGNMKVVKGSDLMKGWNIMHTQHISSLQSKEDIKGGLNKICRNIRKTRVVVAQGDKQFVCNTYILGIKGEFCILNMHALSGAEEGELHICETGINSPSMEKYRITKFSKENYMYISNDVILMRVSADIFLNIEAFCARDMIYPSTANGYLAKHEIKVYHHDKSFKCLDSAIGTVTSESYFEYEFKEHKKGMCGLPVVIQKDSGFSLVGIHCAGSNNDDKAYAFPVDFKKVFDSMNQLLSRSSMMPMHSSTESLLDLEEPSIKSPFRYEELHGLRYYGKTKGKVMIHNVSKLKQTFLANRGNLNEMFFDIYAWQPTQIFGAPMMSPTKKNGLYISPYNIGIKKMSTQNKSITFRLAEKVVEEYSKHIVKGLHEKGIMKWTPYTFEEVVNGVEGNDFIRRVNATTSAGYGYAGKKSKFLPIVHEEPGILKREMSSSLKSDVDELLNEYVSGRCSNILFDVQLKDEARKIEKCESGKTRLFYMAPLHYLVVKKMFMTPFNAAMTEHGEIFGSRIGINMHMEADKIFRSGMKLLQNFGELDVEDYDLKMPFMLGWAAASVEYNVSKMMGFNDEALNVMAGVLTDSLHVKIHMKGDVFEKPALKPSGDDGTAHNNCVRTRLMLMVLWYMIMECKDYRYTTYNITDTYGDDMLMLISEFFQKYYNNETIAALSESQLGMKCTSATKDGKMEPLVNKNRMSFLKRTFAPKKELDNLIVAPLDMNSIFKTLQWHLPSGNVSEENQMASSILSAITELYFHSNEHQYSTIRGRLISEYCQHFNVDVVHFSSYIPTFYVFTEKFKNAYRHTLSDEEKLLSDNQVATIIITECDRLDDRLYQYGDKQIVLTNSPLLDSDNPLLRYEENRLANPHNLLYLKYELLDQLKDARQRLLDLRYPYSGLHPRDIRKIPLYGKDVRFRMFSDDFIHIYSFVTSLEQTIIVLNKQIALKDFQDAHLQADISVSTIGLEEQRSMNQTIGNNSGEPAYEEKIGTTHDQEIIGSSMFAPSMFVERPIKLGTFTLAPETDLNYVNNIWENFFLNSDVRAKLRRYALFKADMVIKIEVAGQQFHSGKIQIAYVPCFGTNQIHNDYTSTAVYRYQFLQWLSQLEGTTVTDPRFNQPIIIHAPYISPQPVMRLYNNNALAISDSTPFDDVHNRGLLHISTINQIKVTNSTSAAPVSFIVSAWLENVQYGVSTGTVMQITTESQRDERITGPIEKVSMAAASVARALTSVPFISPYAKASEMAFNALGSFASIFGFSTPTINTAPSHVKNEPYQCTANVIGYRTSRRITLDPKQELSISQDIVASNKDEMNIGHIASRKTLLTTFVWPHGTEPFASKLWDCLVNPKVGGYVDQPDQYFVQPTALAYVANIAQYWRGDIEFTFEIVASNFHKGKLAIGYEPNIPQLALSTTNLQLNERPYQIFDIQDVQEITYCVSWANAKEWLCTMLEIDVIKSMNGAEFDLGHAFKTCNGYLFVTPYLALQSPDNSDIHVNVYISCKNLELNFATDEFFPWDMTFSSAELEDLKVDVLTECDRCLSCFGNKQEDVELDLFIEEWETYILSQEPEQFDLDIEGDPDVYVYDVSLQSGSTSTYPSTCDILNPTSATKIHICDDYFGERITTLRSLLKRFSVTNKIPLTGTSGTDWAIRLTLPIIPHVLPTPSAGTDRRGVSLFNYLRFSYLGMRGTLSKRFYILGSNNDNQLRVNVSLADPTDSTTIPSMVFIPYTSIVLPFNGTECYMPNTNAGIEYELPFYSNNLFVWSCDTNPYTTGDKTLEPHTLRHYVIDVMQHGSQSEFLAIEETSIGEDFSYLRFLAATPYSISK